MNIHTTTVPAHFSGRDNSRPLKVAPNRLAHRVDFQPVGEKGPGLYAKVPAPIEGRLRSVAVRLAGKNASGSLFLSIIDPTFEYDAFFLYTFLEDIPVTQKGPKMWRRNDIHGAAFSTSQGTQGFLYFLILDGPGEAVQADIALTVETD